MSHETFEEKAMKAQAVPTVEPQGQEVVTISTGNVAAAILRAAENPNIDPERLDRFLAVYERLAARDAEKQFNEAMAAAQDEMKRVAKDAESDKGGYASFAAIDRMVRPIYVKHGLSLSFNTGKSELSEHILILCDVRHTGGHTQRYQVDMPADGKGAKGGDVMTKTHATGSAMTYGQRYLTRMIFNIAIGADDDGAAAGAEVSNEELDFIAEINDAADLAALVAWRDQHYAAARKHRRVITAYNDRSKRLKEAARAKSDFPGDRK
jgi:hypothetical protein